MRARPALGTLPPARRHVAFLGGPGARYAECPPPPELAPWVAVLWRIEAPVGFELRIAPDGCMDLIGDDVIGSFSRPGTVTFRPGDVAEGVRLHPGGFPGAVSRDSGYGERQIRRRVTAATGHGPKRLMRIARMQGVLKAGRGESWARTAAEHGYYDEAHMANDVRALAGATPHALLG